MSRLPLIAISTAWLAMFAFAQAQQQSPGQRDDEQARPRGRAGQRAERRADGQRADGRGRAMPDPAEMRKRMLSALQRRLDATDEEWKTMSPDIEKIITLRREIHSGPGAMRRRAAADTGEQVDETVRKLSESQRELADLLEQPDASENDINQKLRALRNARERARGELEKTQRDLKRAVDPRQEAILVLSGILE